jgi:hypothetical protein
MIVYGKLPADLGAVACDLKEVMYYLYLPVRMGNSAVLLPSNIECIRPLIQRAELHANKQGKCYRYCYVSARKGWATPDNPLNRPGWHCDGFGTDDLNFVWWAGPGTRFAHQAFENIKPDHSQSLTQFDEQVRSENIVTFPERCLYVIDPSVVHATPQIEAPGCWRQYIKISMSDERYNLENNSHNYMFTYNWPLHSREMERNDPHRANAA